MELFSLLLLLGSIAAVYAIMLRPSSDSSRTRRRMLGISGNHRDRDPLASSILVAMALTDTATAATYFKLSDAVVVGVLLALVLSVRAMRGLVYTVVGAIALLSALRELATDKACGGVLTAGQRTVVYLVTAAFLLVVAVCRLLVAPLRATRSEARGALLAVYGVLQTTVVMLQLQAAGGFTDWPLPSYAVGAILLGVLAFGTAVQPVFATASLGVGLAVLSIVGVGAAECLDTAAVVGVLAGYASVGLAVKTIRRRSTAAH